MKNAHVRSAAAVASAASSPAAIAASHQARLLASMNRRPSSEAGKAIPDCGSTLSPRGHMQAQAEQHEIPTDPHRARSELRPMVVHVRRVLELESGPSPGRLAQTQLDPAHLPAVLPRGREATGRFAALDQSARVALDLVAPTLAQLTRDGQKPVPLPTRRVTASTCSPPSNRTIRSPSIVCS